jgi:arylsulfatase A-like enzyme
LYEGGIRVPFIANWPGKIKPAVTNQIAALWDMYPTFLQIAAIQDKKNIDGISLLPTFLKKGKQRQHNYLYWEFHENDGRQALRWQNYKLIILNVSINKKTVIELYDLQNDPGEKNNIAAANPSIVAKLQAFIKTAHTSNKDWPLLPQELY